MDSYPPIITLRPRSYFRLTPRQLYGHLSPAERRRLARRPGTSLLEKKLGAYLSQLPQITLRGAAEELAGGFYHFLISSTPIRDYYIREEWLVSPEETLAPVFFHKLYATVCRASEYGLKHLKEYPQSSSLLLVFSQNYYPISEKGDPFVVPGQRLSLYASHFGLPLPTRATTFPIGNKGDLFLGTIKYQRRHLQALLELPHDLPLEQAVRWEVFRNAIFYHHTLQYLLRFAEKNL